MGQKSRVEVTEVGRLIERLNAMLIDMDRVGGHPSCGVHGEPQWSCAFCLMALLVPVKAELAASQEREIDLTRKVRKLEEQPRSCDSCNQAREAAEAQSTALRQALQWALNYVERELRTQHIHKDDPFDTCKSPQCMKFRELVALASSPSVPPERESGK